MAKRPMTQAQLKSICKKVLALPDNKVCADCPSKRPSWASVNLGCFVCLSCSGIHRSMGTHISFVQSINLDTPKEKHLRVLAAWGNKKANAYWEARIPKNVRRPTLNDSQSQNQVCSY